MITILDTYDAWSECFDRNKIHQLSFRGEEWVV